MDGACVRPCEHPRIVPDPAPSPARPAPPALRRNLLLDLTGAVGLGTTMVLVNSLLPSVARREGLEPLGLAALAAAPFLANLLGVLAGRFGPRTPRGLGLMRAAGAALLIGLVLLPIPAFFEVIAFAFWLTIAFGIPMQHRIWAAIYPVRRRGRYLGVITTGRTAAAAVAALAGGLIADRIGGLGAIAIGGGIGVMCGLIGGGIRASLAESGGSFAVRETWRAWQEVPALRRVGWAQVFYGGGLIAAGPLYALVQVDRLDLTLAQVGSVGVVGALAATFSSLAWGALSERRGGLGIIQLGTMLGAASIVLWAVAPSIAFLWAGAALAGLANAAMETGWPSLVAEHTSLADRAKAVAGLNALTGARGLVAPFVAPLLVQAGILGVEAALLLCAVATALGALLYSGMRPSGEVRPWLSRVDAGAQRGMRRARSLLPPAPGRR